MRAYALGSAVIGGILITDSDWRKLDAIEQRFRGELAATRDALVKIEQRAAAELPATRAALLQAGASAEQGGRTAAVAFLIGNVLQLLFFGLMARGIR